ncbi:MAG: transporter substrate-binding domain-containing protein [Candidatus Accumulibacter sp.]|jgi:polar amino acid transport system substrate-binding protein|nr:transporter substrate-binding domain-containing protein [Accumulibacter sp.]
MRASRLVALFAAVVAVLFSGMASASDPSGNFIAAIKARGVVRVVVLDDNPPFSYIDRSGKNQGYDIYFARRLAKELLGDENRVEFVTVEPIARVDALESGRADIALANFTVTPERARWVDFANPYLRTAIGVVSNDATPVTRESDLQGKKLIVTRGTTADVYFSRKKDIELVKYDHISDAFQALIDGRGVGLAQDTMLVLAWAHENKGFSVKLSNVGKIEPIAPAVRKGNTGLRDWINDTLVKLGKERFAHAAYEATLRPFYGNDANPDDIVIEGGAL